jgi:cell division protein FtsA
LMNKNISEYKDQLIFALDIGTRSVVGILGTMIEDKYTVLDYEQRFHGIRAMRDGQVEDIELVSRVCREVKEALESRNDVKLTSVAIAAAGRALKTCRAAHEQTIPNPDKEITDEMVRALEYSAIAKAQEEFVKNIEEEENQEFQCVGYSVFEYTIDGYPIRNLEGHKGSRMSADVIAAFLPFSVVKSLYAVTARCDLEVRNLTLEPIAAINVIVPPDVRLLNIAIADIGAGTSDVAISKGGSIIAYDMATIAGDEITESIMSAYLTDFDTAETIKKSLDAENDSEVTFEDILGFSYTYKSSEILKKINDTIEALAQAISDSILKNNEGSPVAVFLIGGGSQIPGLCEKVSNKLDMPPNRVALGGTKAQKHIDAGFEHLMSPEFVTPIGIGTVAAQYKGADFFAIKVNGRRIMLMHNGTIKVLDALLLAGINATSLLGRSSRGITYFVNGEKRHARGSLAIPGSVELNGKQSVLEAEVKQGDELIVIPAEDGKDPELHIYDVPEVRDIPGWDCAVFKNGKRIREDCLIANMDDIQLVPLSPEEAEAERIAQANAIAEGYDAYDEEDEDADDIEGSGGDGLDSLGNESAYDSDNSQAPGAEATDGAGGEAASDGASDGADETAEDDPDARYLYVTLNGEQVKVKIKEAGDSVQFMDLLEYSDIDSQEPAGRLVLTLNGNNAAYIDKVVNGDVAVIEWES